MSASVYNNPYTYKPQQPKIDWPPFCHGCSQVSCRFVLDSKVLALAVLLLGVSILVIIGMIIAPFWFQLVLDKTDGTFGSEPTKLELTIDTGLFYMRDSKMDNTLFMNKFTTSREVIPRVLQSAQVCSVIGTCVLVGCFLAGVILMIREFASATALIVLAGATSMAALCEVFVVIFAGILLGMSTCNPYESTDCKYEKNQVWRMVPIYDQFYRIEPHITPFVKPNWAFYIAIVGAAISVGNAIMFWIEAIKTNRNLEHIRYQQLRLTRDPFEHDVDPLAEKKYVYKPPTQKGPNTFGMQPVLHAGRSENLGYTDYPRRDEYIPPASLRHDVSFQPSTPEEKRRGPPSFSSSASGAIVSREIDL
ncbi:hypothetical protein Bpfe_004179 [Biomphalaria pfeifferi]|uniref:Uncharacterized protein n=1 Tax=Biomphalaria pfeifferi TaxID=112525 RepID=A0AAD8C4D0_BIOPF|nr:hypothetical protein Bpfe_004179 [Biomphalaria pfeifferi]